MPILIEENNAELRFGYGDIGVSSGVLENAESVGVVAFTEYLGTVETIGEYTEYEEGIIMTQEETPVMFTFDRVESIDVVIRALERTKKHMINNK